MRWVTQGLRHSVRLLWSAGWWGLLEHKHLDLGKGDLITQTAARWLRSGGHVWRADKGKIHIQLRWHEISSCYSEQHLKLTNSLFLKLPIFSGESRTTKEGVNIKQTSFYPEQNFYVQVKCWPSKEISQVSTFTSAAVHLLKDVFMNHLQGQFTSHVREWTQFVIL